VVEPGDTLVGIAARFGVTLEALRRANPNLQPELLQIGHRVAIPAGEGRPQGPGLLPVSTPLPLPIVGFGLYETPVGGLWGLGEVVNPMETSVENVRVEVTLYRTDGSESASVDSWVARDVIPAGESSPFGVLFPDPPADLGSHRIALVGGESVTRPITWHPHLSIVRQQGWPAGSVYRVTGEVLNTGDRAAEELQVLVTLYNPEGQVTGFREEALPGNLLPGAQEAFDILVSPVGSGTDHHTATVSGRPTAAHE
jgi:LysM repeat protein